MSDKVLKVRVTLKGRPVRAYTFSKDVITVGRDPGADICLDNPGVSREHAKLDFTSSGIYRIQDLNSANGIFVNEQPVKTHFIINNDVVFIGKFALWFMYEEDRRNERDVATVRAARTHDEGTTVLRTSELQEMIESMREAEKNAPPPDAPTASPMPMSPAPARAGVPGAAPMVAATVTGMAASRRTRSLVVLGLLLAFAAGYVTGGGLSWVSWQPGLRALPGAAAQAQP